MFLSEKLEKEGLAPVCWDMQTDMIISRLDGKRVQWVRDSLQMQYVDGVACVKIEDLRNLPFSVIRNMVPQTDVIDAARAAMGDQDIHHNG